MRHFKMVAGVLVAALSGVAHADCLSSELSLRWPMAGRDGIDWVINNYVDLDSGAGTLRDFMNNTGSLAKTYDGHNGIDVDVPDFRYQDAGVAVNAAADGVVTATQADLYDREMEGRPGCGAWNFVTVKHANGYTTSYGHLRQNSVVVAVGQSVVAGQLLGLIGSAGCSSTSHLHFMVNDCSGKVLEPFQESMWANGPQYNSPLRVMDFTVRKGGFPETSTDALVKDPPPNAPTFPSGSRIGVGLSTAGGVAGDRLEVLIRKPDGNVYVSFSPIVYSQPGRHGWPRWWVNLPTTSDFNGRWNVEVRVNNNLTKVHNFTIQRTNDAVFQGLTEPTYQQTFDSVTNDGYKPKWVDGSGNGPNQLGRMSAIFRREAGPFQAYHNLDGTAYQVAFNQAINAGLQLESIDNYLVGGQVKIAAVFSGQWSPGWRAYHLVTREDHLARFEQLKSEGYRPYAISVVVADGRQYISAAYTNNPSQGWAAWYGLSAADYQAEFDRQTQLGRAPIYIDVYDDAGTPRFSAIWSVEGAQHAWAARHEIDEATYFRFNEEQAQAGRVARVVSSYIGSGGRRMYAGVWSAP